MADLEEGADEQELEPDQLLIQDFNHYLRTHGLSNEEPQYGAQSRNNRAEAQRRVDESKAYQDEIHQRFFAAKDQEEKQNELPRGQILQALSENQRIALHTADGSVQVPLRLLASTCETIYSLVACRNLFQRPSEHEFEFSLDAFSGASVEEFFELVAERKPVHEANTELVVDCCQIAHYLQCPQVLDPIVEILVRSVDTDNCMSLAQLADRLDLPVLFERSLSHMMFSLHEVEENSEIWDNVSQELKDRIQLIQVAIKTSIHGGGQTNLYFASLQEYLAIFAEQVDYHKERLAEAKRSQDRVSRDRLSWKNWKYAEEKIAKQEQRVKTMVMVMKEQKKLFAAKDANLRINDMNSRTE